MTKAKKTGRKKRKIHRVPLHTRIDIALKLKKVVIIGKRARDGSTAVEYRGRHTDVSIAEEFGVTKWQVKYIRDQLFGSVTHMQRGFPKARYLSVIERLEKICDRLEAVITNPDNQSAGVQVVRQQLRVVK